MLNLADKKINFYLHPEAGTLPLHQDIPEEYTWKLEDIYESADEWEKDFNWLKENSIKIKNFEGKLSDSKNLLECLKLDEEIGIKLGKVFLYAMLNKDLNLSDTNWNGRYDRVINLHAIIQEYSSFLIPEIQTIPREVFEKFTIEQPKLKIYSHFFENLKRMQPHTLDKEKEKLLAMAQPISSAPYEVFSLLENADLEFPEIEDEKGKPVKISHGRYTSAMFSADRAYRLRVYKNYYKPFIAHKNVLAALYSSNIKGGIFNARARNYKTTLEAALFNNNIPVKIYDNLINTVKENLNPLHRWANIKKEYLKLKEFHPYDTYVTLFPAVQKKFTFDEAKQLTLKALAPLGKDYLDQLRYAFEHRWLDVFETRNKRSGAYSSGTTYGVHPYVLLNWNNTLNDVFTLVHEMGHSLHSYYTLENQPYPYADYTIFLAEIASTTNEALLLDYLIKNAQSQEEKLFLLEKYLLNAVTTFYRQTRFAEFEKITHEIALNGGALTYEKLCDLYGNLYLQYWGKAMTMDEEETFTWARVPHFYYNFYVYQYATGFAAAQTFAENIARSPEESVDKYLNFLKAGSSDYSIEILKNAGVDMNSPEPILAVINKMNLILDEMESLIKN